MQFRFALAPGFVVAFLIAHVLTAAEHVTKIRNPDRQVQRGTSSLQPDRRWGAEAPLAAAVQRHGEARRSEVPSSDLQRAGATEAQRGAASLQPEHHRGAEAQPAAAVQRHGEAQRSEVPSSDLQGTGATEAHVGLKPLQHTSQPEHGELFSHEQALIEAHVELKPLQRTSQPEHGELSSPEQPAAEAKPTANTGIFGDADSALAPGSLEWFVQALPLPDVLISLLRPLDIYTATVPGLFIITILLAWKTRPLSDEPLSDPFRRFRQVYLTIWFLAVGADWLQGPYVYALYDAYGYNTPEIAKLFVAGFSASMVCGTIVGSFADIWGRKRCCVLYCVLYSISCFTKHIKSYHVLLIGRVLGGISTSLLFSSFECWMIGEHTKQKFSKGLLRHMLGLMFYGMYITAVIAGAFSQLVIAAAPLRPIQRTLPFDLHEVFYVGGYTLPFDFALILLMVAWPAIWFFWEENYGESRMRNSVVFSDALVRASAAFWAQPRMVFLGICAAGFEGSMYAFILNWTPVLNLVKQSPPRGLVFSLFMMSCVCGSCFFRLLHKTVRPTAVLLPTLCLATLACGAVVLCLRKNSMLWVSFFCFLAFEFCVGMYYPAIAVLKSSVVPESSRAGVYNIFRFPLNAVIVVLLLNDASPHACFSMCCVLLVAALLALLIFDGLLLRPREKRAGSPEASRALAVQVAREVARDPPE